MYLKINIVAVSPNIPRQLDGKKRKRNVSAAPLLFLLKPLYTNHFLALCVCACVCQQSTEKVKKNLTKIVSANLFDITLKSCCFSIVPLWKSTVITASGKEGKNSISNAM